MRYRNLTMAEQQHIAAKIRDLENHRHDMDITARQGRDPHSRTINENDVDYIYRWKAIPEIKNLAYDLDRGEVREIISKMSIDYQKLFFRCIGMPIDVYCKKFYFAEYSRIIKMYEQENTPDIYDGTVSNIGYTPVSVDSCSI